MFSVRQRPAAAMAPHIPDANTVPADPLTALCNWMADHPWSVTVLVCAAILFGAALDVPS